MREVSQHFGNASSVHAWGRQGRRLVNESREKLAAILNVPEATIFFTSGGTEAINLALVGSFLPFQKQQHLIVSSVEHAAVLKTAEFLKRFGVEITYLSVDALGRIDPFEIENSIKPHTKMIAVMFANNEIGNLYPVKKIGEIARSHGIRFFCDAVQAMGKLPINLSHLPIDMMAGSAHKFHGPKGMGFLYLNKGVEILPFLHGGGQEKGYRPGTENIPAIVGMATALDLAMRDLEKTTAKIASLRDRLQAGIFDQFPEVLFHGDLEHRISNTLNFRIPGVSGESLLMNLDLAGIGISVGAACESGSLEPSHVLTRMGLSDEEALQGLRFSLSRFNGEVEIEKVLKVLSEVVGRGVKT
jgi:cysteine desulfurase